MFHFLLGHSVDAHLCSAEISVISIKRDLSARNDMMSS